MLKKLCFALLLSLAFSCISFAAGAQEQTKIIETGVNPKYQVILDDRIDLLSDEEEKAVLEAMRPISQYGFVVFVTSNESGKTEHKAAKALGAHAVVQNGVVFLIDMKNREIYLYSGGEMEKVITRSQAYQITAENSRYASRKEYGKCAVQVFTTVNNELQGKHQYSLMRIICDVMTAAVLGLLIAYFFVSSRQKQKVADRSQLTNARNIVIRTDLEFAHFALIKTIDISSSSSGGGGSGGGSSSGSSGGSGGGSRF